MLSEHDLDELGLIIGHLMTFNRCHLQ